MRRGVEFFFEVDARRLQRRIVGVAWDPQRLGRDPGAAAERQIDRRVIPIVEHDTPARGDGARIDGTAGGLSELDDAEAGDARHFGDIRRERDGTPFLERVEHGLESGDARFVDEAAAVVARAADGADAQPLGGNRVDLAVAVTRHQHFHLVFDLAPERRDQMLAVPERKNNRHIGLAALINVGRFKREP